MLHKRITKIAALLTIIGVLCVGMTVLCLAKASDEGEDTETTEILEPTADGTKDPQVTQTPQPTLVEDSSKEDDSSREKLKKQYLVGVILAVAIATGLGIAVLMEKKKK